MRLKRPKLFTAITLATLASAMFATGARGLDAQPSDDSVLEGFQKTQGDDAFQWWNALIKGSILPQPHFVSFDLNTILIDTLNHSPRILGVSNRASMALEQVVQQDAAFDAMMLFETNAGHTNDPVGNTLTTGGPPRSIQDSFSASAGIRRTSRDGTTVDLSQELGTLNSNSLFFSPTDQGNSRLSLSLSRPLLARGGQVYTERLLTNAQIESGISWQEMRRDVEKRIAEVMIAYWELYQSRCHFLQQQKLIERGVEIERVIQGRCDFDSSRIERTKTRGRIARRVDQVIEAEAQVRRQQARLAMLVGSEALAEAESRVEMIPTDLPLAEPFVYDLRSAVLVGLKKRPEVRAAAGQLESAALALRISRNQLLPQLDAVIDGYLAGLNGNYAIFRSFSDQFSNLQPGISAGLQYELPRGNRFARSRNREAMFLYRQRAEELREAIQLTRAEIESAVINVQTAIDQQQSKREMVLTATAEEEILTQRYLLLGGDGSRVGLVLENLLDAQQRRADAERAWVSTQVQYLVSLIELQRAMGNLLVHESIETVRDTCDNQVNLFRISESEHPLPTQPNDYDNSRELIETSEMIDVESAKPVDRFDSSKNTQPQTQSSTVQSPSVGGALHETGLIETIVERGGPQ
ncbi:Outer membrane efflux protein [Novipirellula aureliae]|uniref:Outer membrane efflux protein n=1 Tax=Novipirellula aureliae TaxID=2527966 RepID=A0A5C6E5Z0_9BACT|nr:TolC family protein [Novipirellula aureliae]TWU43041.1 Outer membrane efflux protein [Novipirellula aureliae]